MRLLAWIVWYVALTAILGYGLYLLGSLFLEMAVGFLESLGRV